MKVFERELNEQLLPRHSVMLLFNKTQIYY